MNWEFTKSDRRLAQQLMDFLADKRVLTIGWGRPESEAGACLASAADCRMKLSEYLDQIQKPNSDLRTWVRAIRQAFTDFIEAGGHDGGRFTDEGSVGLDGLFNQALRDLRERVRCETDLVAKRYKLIGLDLPPECERA
ncbi:hypothetical protein H9Y04_22615 [Streptomyces sp. TRM66268-LWL]|uniref:Uncharacterized protein n=1 Tax=Streptomyces polyasparticus TaxID=2767826 RepID=A0ABR7SLF9_9ACTN|nr:hypothetical protein [Streptomyces polyasparticus]